MGVAAARRRRPASDSSRSPSIGSMWWLWYGTCTDITRQNAPCFWMRALASSIASVSPESVSDAGLLTAATQRRPSYSASSGRSASSPRPTAIMRPWPVARCCSRPAVEGDAHRLVEIHGAGRVHGRDLARAVADDRVRPHAPVPPERQERRLEREVHGLREVRLGHPRRGLVLQQLLDQRPLRMAADQAVALVDDGAEHRLPLEQLAPHAPPLRAHAREHERDARRVLVRRASAHDVRARLVVQERVEVVRERLEILAHDPDAMLRVAALERRRGREVGKRRRIRAAAQVAVGAGQAAQRLGATRRDDEQLRAGRAAASAVTHGFRRRALQHDVRVRAAEPERVDAREGRRVRPARPPLPRSRAAGSASKGIAGFGLRKCRLGGMCRCLHAPARP